MTNVNYQDQPKKAELSGGQNERFVSKRNLARNALIKAETAWYEYASECDIGEERTRAFEIYENVRMAQRVY